MYWLDIYHSDRWFNNVALEYLLTNLPTYVGRLFFQSLYSMMINT